MEFSCIEPVVYYIEYMKMRETNISNIWIRGGVAVFVAFALFAVGCLDSLICSSSHSGNGCDVCGIVQEQQEQQQHHGCCPMHTEHCGTDNHDSDSEEDNSQSTGHENHHDANAHNGGHGSVCFVCAQGDIRSISTKRPIILPTSPMEKLQSISHYAEYKDPPEYRPPTRPDQSVVLLI